MKSTESKEIILNCGKLERRFVMLRNGRIEAYEIEREDKMPKVGDIYLGRIVNLDPMLQAAFVDIGAQKNAFLHYHDMLPGNSELIEQFQSERGSETPQGKGETLSVKRRKRTAGSARSEAESQRRNRRISTADIPCIFKPGSEILVQVVKAPISTKGARVTTDISIPGRFLVLMPYCEHLGLSTRIEGAGERERLRKILADLELPEGMGLICRTVGAGRKANFFKNDLGILLDYWHKIEEDMENIKAPALLFTEPNLIERSVRDFLTEDITGVVVDDKDAYRSIISSLKRIGGKKMTGKIHFYNSAVPVYEYYKINDQLREVFQRELHLPGGGAIVIDETEAMIAIDVNSGHGRKSAADQPDFILKTNLEAAEEIARQLILRDIGGLVVIDFIDMRTQKERDEVYKLMK
ncbi:MAG: Rne/Rng family ribonuclease, partial [Lentisphaeria bacterium]|nr:Rne/Rng family ribonuclease [Lentisphaeria bacterium]